MKKIVVLCGIFGLCVGGVYAINTQLEGFQIVKNTSQEIRVHGDCKKITNNSQFWDAFIPTRSVEEWNSVKNNSSAPHLKIENCRPQNINIGNIGSDTGLQMDFDHKWRITRIKIVDGRLLYDGVYAKGIRVKFSADDLASMLSAQAQIHSFDDYFELKLNDQSVFSGPDNKAWLVMCSCIRQSTRSCYERSDGQACRNVYSCRAETKKLHFPNLENLPITDIQGIGDIVDKSLVSGVMWLPWDYYYMGVNNSCAKEFGPVERDTHWQNFVSNDFKHLLKPDEYNLFLWQLFVKRHGVINYDLVFTYWD